MLTLLEEAAAVLSHAHARGVLHGNITPMAIVRAPTLRIQRWEDACIHDTELSSDAIDGRDDVFALGTTVFAALARPDAAPEALNRILVRMLAVDPALRPTAPEVVTAARALRDALATDVDGEVPEIVIEYPAMPADDDEPILLERRHIPTVIVDLDACG